MSNDQCSYNDDVSERIENSRILAGYCDCLRAIQLTLHADNGVRHCSQVLTALNAFSIQQVVARCLRAILLTWQPCESAVANFWHQFFLPEITRVDDSLRKFQFALRVSQTISVLSDWSTRFLVIISVSLYGFLWLCIPLFPQNDEELGLLRLMDLLFYFKVESNLSQNW